MTLEECAIQLRQCANPEALEWARVDTLWHQAAVEAERIAKSVLPDAFCTAQEWDQRIDCAVKLTDGQIAGEMILLSELTEPRIKETAIRLRRRLAGDDISLVNELRRPILITREAQL